MAKAERFTRVEGRVKNPVCTAWVFPSRPGVGVRPLKGFVTAEEAQAWAKGNEYVFQWEGAAVNTRRK